MQPAPPATAKNSLATPGALTNLNLSDQWRELSEQQFPDTVVADSPDGFAVTGAGVDLQDGYYQFALPQLSSWFALGETFLASEVGVSEIFDDDLNDMRAVDPDERLWACFAGLPLYWSCALYMCHSALEECGRRALQKCNMPS